MWLLTTVSVLQLLSGFLCCWHKLTSSSWSSSTFIILLETFHFIMHAWQPSPPQRPYPLSLACERMIHHGSFPWFHLSMHTHTRVMVTRLPLHSGSSNGDLRLLSVEWSFLSRVSILLLTRDIDNTNSVRLSVCPSVRDTLVLYENGSTYRHSFSPYGRPSPRPRGSARRKTASSLILRGHF